MYKLSGKLKLFSIVLMVIGLVGLTYGFLNVPKTVDDVKEILAAQNSHHEGGAASSENEFVDKARGEEGYSANAMEQHESEQNEALHMNHDEHVLHQLQARPWSATLVSAFFFFMIALGALVFYAIQYASKAGWSPVLYRVMEGITSYLLPGSIIVLLIVLLAGTHFYPWQNEELVSGDKILEGKSGYLNFPFFVIRALIFLTGWNLYRYFSRKFSRKESKSDVKPYIKNYKMAAVFLVFFALTELIMSWDWFMSMTPHWYSTMFAWYIFATMFVSAITTIAFVTIYLKSKGYLGFVSDSHLHDLAKYMFAFSIFWTYLWFGQFMLIWYANMPEEVVYFVLRIQHYTLPFFGMLILNFVCPILILMNSDYKRVPWFIVLAGIAILVGHYIDVFLLVMPSTVGTNWSFGIPEIAGICFFLGLFIYIVGTGLSKTELHPEGNPFIKESEQFHY